MCVTQGADRMEYSPPNVVVLFFLFVGHVCAAQNPPLKVQLLDPKEHKLTVGQSASLSCSVNRPMTLILDYHVTWVHYSLATQTERNLTIQAALGPATSPDEFDIDFNYTADGVVFQLKILSASDAEDGEFICRVIDAKKGVILSSEPALVTVVHDVQYLSLMFDGMDSVTGEDNALIQLEEGEHGVTCEAQGFNGQLKTTFLLGDEPLSDDIKVEIELDKVASSQARGRRFVAIAVLPRLHLTAADTGKKVTCVAEISFPNARALRVSIPVEVISLLPVVYCDEASTAITNATVNITCIVDHTFIPVQQYVWENGETGERFDGDITSDTTRVFITGLNITHTEVSLVVYNLNGHEGYSNYFLDVLTKAGATRYVVVVTPPPDISSSASNVVVPPTKSSSATTTTNFTLLLLLLLALRTPCC